MRKLSRRLAVVLAGAALGLVGGGAGMASAASPSQEQCEAQGGTFTRTNGEVSCVTVDEGKNPKFTETETTSGQGNISNKQEQDTACGGTGSGKCPPGQF